MVLADNICIIELDNLLVVGKDHEERKTEDGQFTYDVFILLLYYSDRKEVVKTLYQNKDDFDTMFENLVNEKCKDKLKLEWELKRGLERESDLKIYHCKYCNGELELGTSKRGKSTATCKNCGKWYASF